MKGVSIFPRLCQTKPRCPELAPGTVLLQGEGWTRDFQRSPSHQHSYVSHVRLRLAERGQQPNCYQRIIRRQSPGKCKQGSYRELNAVSREVGEEIGGHWQTRLHHSRVTGVGELMETAGCLHLHVSQAAGEEPDECPDAAVQPGGTQRVLSPPAFPPSATHQLTHVMTGTKGHSGHALDNSHAVHDQG